MVDAENKPQLAQLAEQFNEYNAYNNFELDKDIQKMESQSVKNSPYLTPSPYPKHFSPIPNSLDNDLKDKTENILYIPTSLKTVLRNLIQGNFSKNSNTSGNSNKPHSRSN